MKICRTFKTFGSIAMVCATSLAFAQGIPPEQWTQSEKQFVDGSRILYQQQGLGYTEEQASKAVYQMRQQRAPVQRGVPETEWTAQERSFVEATRKASGGNLSDEQARLTVQSMREQIARFTGAVGAMQLIAQQGFPAGDRTANTGGLQPTTSTPSNVSEEQLGRTIASWPAKQGDLLIKGRRDGFDVNGRPFLDPEGRMFSYAFDVTAGSITYAVKTSRGVTIKSLNAVDTNQSVVIATGSLGNSGWEIQTATGKQLTGDTLSILSNGFLVGRTASAFRYQPGKGVRSIAMPSGFVLAPLQRGNVGATGYILLEKEGAIGGNDPLTGLFSSIKSIGSIVGAVKKADYSLMNIENGKTFDLNFSANGKQLTLMSQCRQRNWILSECQKAQTVESVYGEDGYKNNSHYYWLVNWVGTPSGPVAISLEDGLSNIYITDLISGKKIPALNRTLGIADWEVNQRGDGVVGIKAKLAFEWKEIPDVVAFMQSSN